MKLLLLIIFLLPFFISSGQQTDSQNRKADSQMIDQKYKTQQDSIDSVNMNRNMQNFIQTQKERERKEKQRMYIRIALGIFFLLVLILGLTRKRKQKDATGR